MTKHSYALLINGGFVPHNRASSGASAFDVCSRFAWCLFSGVSGSFASYRLCPNPAVDLAPFGRWTLRDEAAQRRSPLR